MILLAVRREPQLEPRLILHYTALRKVPRSGIFTHGRANFSLQKRLRTMFTSRKRSRAHATARQLNQRCVLLFQPRVESRPRRSGRGRTDTVRTECHTIHNTPLSSARSFVSKTNTPTRSGSSLRAYLRYAIWHSPSRHFGLRHFRGEVLMRFFLFVIGCGLPQWHFHDHARGSSGALCAPAAWP